MVNLLDDLRRVPTPLAVRSRSMLVSLVKQAQVQMLRASIGAPIDSESPRLSADLRRFALWLEHAAFVDGHMEDSILEVTSALYEFAATLSKNTPTTIYRPPLNDLLRSAIASSSSSFPGKATVIGERLDDVLRSTSVDNENDRHQVLVARCIVSFLARKFQRSLTLAEACRRLYITLGSTEDLVEYPHGHPSEVAQMLIDAIRDVSLGMLIGELNWIDLGIRQLGQVVETAATRDDASGFWLANRLLATSQAMSDSSMHRRLGFFGTPIPRRYRQLLAAEGFLELWSPQLLAVDQGILDPLSKKHFVISIPTGAGKTFIAEMLILASLSGNSGWALYVVPSRALVNQVSQDLKRRLNPVGVKVRNVVAGPEQSIIVSEEMELLRKDRTVVIMTPEKLDTYLRFDASAFEGCQLLILDEAHHVGESTRGALAETLIARFLVTIPGMRIAVLSGVMSNIEDFSAWLGSERTRIVSEPRRPTRQTYSIAVSQAPPVSEGDLVEKYDKKLQRRKNIKRVDFKGGLVIVNEDEDLTSDIEVDVADVFSGFVTLRQRGASFVKDPNERNSRITEHTRQIVERYAEAPGTILAFFNYVKWVESISAKTNVRDTSFLAERLRLSEFVSLELGSDHPLVECCRKGIGYHHARLPLSIQRAIEYALEEGWLKVVYATPTLREGVNTSASTVILGGLVFRNGSESIPMSVMNFANVAGRAGRPRRETAGQIVLVPDKLSVASLMDNGNRYILSGADARRVESQLRRIERSLQAADEILEDLPVEEQRLLLGIVASGLSSNEQLSVFVDNTLWSAQETNHAQVESFVRRAAITFASAEHRFGLRLDIAAKSSLALSSAEVIRQHILDNIDIFSTHNHEREGLLHTVVRSLLEVGLDLDEMQSMIHSKTHDPDHHLNAVASWIGGGAYQEVLEAGKSSSLFKPSEKLGASVKYCSDISTWLSWVAGAVWLIADAELDAVDPIVGKLPLLIKYGVPTVVGAYVAILGVSDRNAILQLANRFMQTGIEESIQNVSDWLDTLDLDVVFPTADHYLRADLLRRQSFGHVSHAESYSFASYIAYEQVATGTRIELERENNNLYLNVGAARIGVVTKRTLGQVLPIWNKHKDNAIAMITSQSSDRNSGVFVFVPLRD